MLPWQNDRPAWVLRALKDEPRKPVAKPALDGMRRCPCGVRFWPRNLQQKYHDDACKERQRRGRRRWRWGGG